ncbi:unnamed protein product [Rotaria sp. Silwood2]|nr:unnamed protein product [Rotaria sp. Silwood2]CAF2836844.1 unnamed protein product [Rotaria sp. Silwood2]CAF3241981.1 unnamed protein product [Rotaria sp. Silwood2]CAF3935956.1 unnamed protein product [Rotaria sp. Silwood2]CAF3980998.1 unnamed protein product [Rotaria sp. Silwood2]
MSFLCLAAFDRWACTSQSARIRQLSSTYVSLWLFPIPFIFWSLFNLPCLIYMDLISPTFTCWFTNDLFEKVTSYFLGPIVPIILPLIILSIFGILTYRHICLLKQVRQQPVQTRTHMWEQQMTRMMFAQTVSCIICTLPRAIYIIYSIATLDERATRSFDRLCIELLVEYLTVFIMTMNFTSSFYIFLLSSPRLRQTIMLNVKHLLHVRHNNIAPSNINQFEPSLVTHKIEKNNIKTNLKAKNIGQN